jgi:prefoldin subunit 5
VSWKGHLQDLELKAKNARKGYLMKGKNVVGVRAKLNLDHMVLPVGSGVSVEQFCNNFPRNVC